MKTLIATILIALSLCVSAAAQIPHPVKVDVYAANSMPASQDIANKLAGQIGASARYELVTKGVPDIMVRVECLPDIVNGRQVAVTCHTDVVYYPIYGVAFSTDLGGDMTESESASEVVQDLFTNFVQSTSDEKLAAEAEDFKRYLNNAVGKYPQGVPTK